MDAVHLEGDWDADGVSERKGDDEGASSRWGEYIGVWAASRHTSCLVLTRDLLPGGRVIDSPEVA